MPSLHYGWRPVLEWGAWVLAAVWCVRTRTLMRRLDEVPDLTGDRWDLCPVGAPALVVVVPAKDEASTIGPAMSTLLAQDYPTLHIVAVDDRSTDATGPMLDSMAARHPARLRVLHLTEAAQGWAGKTFAMETAARGSSSAWILFTDADVRFSPSVLQRALAYAELSGADHVVIAPTPVTGGWGERVVLGFLQVMALWGARPWRVADPKARWDAVGIGAFNLVRREAWEAIGGFAPQRLAVLEDVTLGLRVRAAGLQQRIAFAPGLILVHWATGAQGLIRVMTKNLFAIFNFRLWILGFATVGFCVLFLAPLAGVVWMPTTIPCLLILACIAVCYRALGEWSGIDPRAGWGYPLGALALWWAMLRSAAVTLWRGGVLWRETFYPLRELRRFNNPIHWQWEAIWARAERRRNARGRGAMWMRKVLAGRSPEASCLPEEPRRS